MKIIIYTRVSTDEQANRGHGRDYQLEVLRKYCDVKGYEIVEEFLEDYSAKNFNRPEWKRLETYVKANRKYIDMVMFTKWDRFSRNMEEALSKIRMFERWGIEVNAVEQTLDLSNPDNKMMLSIYLITPEIENDKISQRTRAGMYKAAKEGAWIGKVPFGLSRCRVGKYASVEPSKDAHIVVKMFKQASVHIGSIEYLRKDFVKLGYKGCKQTFLNNLRNKVYIGMSIVPEFEKEDSYWIDGLHDGIIDEITFNKVQNVLNGNKKNAKPPSKRNESLPLRGFLECELCGGTLTGSPSKGNGGIYYYYHCRSGCKNRIRSEKAHKMLNDDVLSSISINENIIELYEQILKDIQKNSRAAKKQNKASLLLKIKNTEKNLENLEDKFVCEDIGAETFKKISNRYNSNLRDLRNELLVVTEAKETNKKIINLACKTLRDIPQLFNTDNYDKKVKLLGLIFPDKLVISKNKCRTKKLNIVIELLNRVDKGFKSSGKEKAIISDGLSTYAPLLGLEPRTL